MSLLCELSLLLLSLSLWISYVHSKVACLVDGSRHRKPLHLLTSSEKKLFFDGFETLRKDGQLEAIMSESHDDVYRIETAIRKLGEEYSCVSMPYWDWTLDSGLEDSLGTRVASDDDTYCLVTVDACCQSSLLEECDCCVNSALSQSATLPSAQEIGQRIYSISDYNSFESALFSDYQKANMLFSSISYEKSCLDAYDPLMYLAHNYMDYLRILWSNCHSSDLANAANGRKNDLSFWKVQFEIGPFYRRSSTEMWCHEMLNSEWFVSTMGDYAEISATNTPVNVYSDQLRQSLLENGFSWKQTFEALASKSCEFVRENSGNSCWTEELDSIEIDDCDDLSDDELLALELDDLLGKNGVNSNECLQEIRKNAWQMVKNSGSATQIRALCKGEFDYSCPETQLDIDDIVTDAKAKMIEKGIIKESVKANIMEASSMQTSHNHKSLLKTIIPCVLVGFAITVAIAFAVKYYRQHSKHHLYQPL